ncbi:MAG: YlxR family protein [Minicystis sp.]
MLHADHHENEGALAHEGDDASVRGRTRSCVGCAERVDLDDRAGALLRLIVSPAGEVAVDARGGGFGRGAHVHPRPSCLRLAAEKGLSRSAKCKVHTVLLEVASVGSPEEAGAGSSLPLSGASLGRAIKEAEDRRIEGFLSAAVRSRQIALGSEAVSGACYKNDRVVVLVATDAPGMTELPEVQRAIEEGRAVSWGTKEQLGVLVYGQHPRAGGVSVLGLLSRNLGEAVREAVQIADAVAATEAEKPTRGGRRGSPPKMSRNSSETGACAPQTDGGQHRPEQGAAGPQAGRPPRTRGAHPGTMQVGQRASRGPNRGG